MRFFLARAAILAGMSYSFNVVAGFVIATVAATSAESNLQSSAVLVHCKMINVYHWAFYTFLKNKVDLVKC